MLATFAQTPNGKACEPRQCSALACNSQIWLLACHSNKVNGQPMKTGKKAVKTARQVYDCQNQVWQEFPLAERSIPWYYLKMVHIYFVHVLNSFTLFPSTPPALPEVILRFWEIYKVIFAHRTTDVSENNIKRLYNEILL